MKVSYIEIYKEELQDLLDTEISSKDLHIREDDKGNTRQYFYCYYLITNTNVFILLLKSFFQSFSLCSP